MNPIVVESASFSYSKNFSERNQDCILPPIYANGAIYFAVADGVGGKYGGRIASFEVIRSVRKTISLTGVATLDKIFHRAHKDLEKFAKSKSYFENMATTLVVCKIDMSGVYIGSVGDSRAYIVLQGELKKITKDQTKKQYLIDNGIFKEDDLVDHPSERILTSFLSPYLDYDLKKYSIDNISDNIVLMSDGVYRIYEKECSRGDFYSKDLIDYAYFLKKISLENPVDDFSFVGVKYDFQNMTGKEIYS